MKPNIVIIMADQLAPHFTGTYGHKVVKTPNLDALAARGMRFDAAYCNSPLCAPSRFSFMSGQLVSRIRAYDNASEFPASTPTFAHYLKLLGYHTCLSGKMHFVGPDQKHGFEDRVTTDIYPADFAWTPDWENPDERIDSFYHNMDPVKESGHAIATFQTDYDDEVGYEARRWMIERGRDQAAGDARPFALVASFMHPHDPYVAKPEFWDLYEDAEIDLPHLPFDYEGADPLSKRILDGIEADKVPVDEEDIINSRRAYYANTTYFDSKVGEIVKTLEDMDALDNTIIIVTADHGDMLGERGLWYKMNFFEHSARVPLIFAGPGIAQGSAPHACSLIDILPSLIDIGGGDMDMLAEPIDGRSLMPLARGGTDDISEAIGEYCGEMASSPIIMIRRGDFKYIYCDIDPPQLYNIKDDPHETANLVDDPAHKDIAAQFEAEIAAKWDVKTLHQDVINTQKSRRVVNQAMVSDGPDAWDYNPPSDASQKYVRNHMEWTAAATRYRYPPLPETD